MRETIAALIGKEHSIELADGYKQALKVLEDHPVELVLMDIEMPDMNGYELTELIRAAHPEWFPIIFLSATSSEQGIVKGIEAGGDDYLTKPVNEKILKAKIRAMERIANMRAMLQEANSQLAQLSNLDSLTQTLNRRGLAEKTEVCWKNYLRVKDEMSVLMIDIDDFKTYNDHYGHLLGDDCLKAVASVIQNSVERATDIVARYGGEEFIIVMPHTDVEGAKLKAAQLLQNMRKANLEHVNSSCATHVTLSIGISSTSLGANSMEDLTNEADTALYKAKSLGKNRLVCYKKSLAN